MGLATPNSQLESMPHVEPDGLMQNKCSRILHSLDEYPEILDIANALDNGLIRQRAPHIYTSFSRVTDTSDIEPLR